MQEKRRFRRIDVDLEGTVRFHQANDTRDCVIRNINEACVGVMIATSDPRVSTREDLNLNINIPADRSPVKCIGRIAWYSENKNRIRDGMDFCAGIFITYISRIDRRRLELVMAHKKAAFGRGLGYQPRYAFNYAENTQYAA